MGSAYRRVLCRGDVLSALIPYVLARLPLSMAPLALLLLAREQTGSYHRAGLACAAYAVAVAISSPIMGRAVDRPGQRPVLLGTGVLHAAAMIAAALAAEQNRFGLLTVSALVAGASLPPVTGCMRALWTRLLPDEANRKAGFAIDGVIVEVAELSGPLLVSLLLLFGRPALAVGVCGALMGIGTLAFRASAASRGVLPSPVVRSPWGALANPGVRRLLMVVVASTATIGAVEVAMTAFARHHGGMSSAGLYIGLISVGGIAAGVLFGGSERFGSRHPATVLTAALLMSAAAAASMAEAPGVAVMSGTLVIFGASIAVGVIVQLSLMSAIVDDSCRTEAFTWGATANFLGLGLGTAAAGWTIDSEGLRAAFVMAAAPTVLAVLVTIVSRSAFTIGPRVDAEPAESAAAVEPTPVALAPAADVAALAEELAALRAHVGDLETALAAALDSPGVVMTDARKRARRMLDRADAACLEMRERAGDDADRVREAATTASLEVLAAAERDARAMLARARREADAIVAQARRGAGPETDRPTLHALPRLHEDEVAPDSGVAATS